jgi:hypothetical protein
MFDGHGERKGEQDHVHADGAFMRMAIGFGFG